MAAYDLASIDEAIARQEDLEYAPAQYARQGMTIEWMMNLARKKTMDGKALYFRLQDAPATGVRREQLNTGANAEWPVGQEFSTRECVINQADHRIFRATTPPLNTLMQDQSMGEHALFDLGKRIFNQIDEDLMDAMNSAFNQDGTCQMATIGQVYDIDGTAFTGGGASAAAYISIAGGGIGQFQRGMVLDIYKVDTFSKTVLVLDVNHTANGPYVSGSDQVSGIGPGLLIQPCTAAGVVEDTDWDVVAIPATDDILARSTEFEALAANYNNINGIPALFDESTAIFREGSSGSLIDRTTAGNQYMIPMKHYPDGATVASPVVLDVERDFDTIIEQMIQRVNMGRKSRKSNTVSMTDSQKAISRSGVMLGLCNTSLIKEAQTQFYDQQRFTLATTMDAKSKKDLVGCIGWDGVVYRSPGAPPIALQGDVAATPHTIRLIDPQSVVMYRFLGKGEKKWNWLPGNVNGSSRWRTKDGTNGRPTAEMQAGAYCTMYVTCDQPGANAEISRVKSSIE